MTELSRTVFRLGVAVVLSVCTWVGAAPGWAGSANGDGRTMRFNALERNGRPANFYRLRYEKEASVCRPLHRALSAPHRNTLISAGILDPGDVFVGNAYSVAWKPRTYLWDIDGRKLTRHMAWAVVDLDNDGRPDGVYRWSESRGLVDSDMLFKAPHHPQDHENLREAIPYKRMIEIIGGVKKVANEVRVNFQKAPEVWSRSRQGSKSAGHASGDFFYDVVSIEGQNFLVALRAFYWFPPVDAFVLRLSPDGSMTLICHFQGLVRVSR